MKRKILIAITAITLGLPVAPAAFARDGRYEDGAHRRHDREKKFVVHFHLDGRRQVQAKSRDRAERIVEFLESVGADAHLDRGRVVHYRMRGEAEIVRYSHEDAHRLVQKLEGYGFHAHVDHE